MLPGEDAESNFSAELRGFSGAVRFAPPVLVAIRDRSPVRRRSQRRDG